MPKFWYQSKQAPNTHRHLCEYIGLHVEMEIKEHYFEVIKKNLCLFAIAAVQKLIGFSCLQVCDILGTLFDDLAEKCGAKLFIIRKQFPCEPLKVRVLILYQGNFRSGDYLNTIPKVQTFAYVNVFPILYHLKGHSALGELSQC